MAALYLSKSIRDLTRVCAFLLLTALLAVPVATNASECVDNLYKFARTQVLQPTSSLLEPVADAPTRTRPSTSLESDLTSLRETDLSPIESARPVRDSIFDSLSEKDVFEQRVDRFVDAATDQKNNSDVVQMLSNNIRQLEQELAGLSFHNALRRRQIESELAEIRPQLTDFTRRLNLNNSLMTVDSITSHLREAHGQIQGLTLPGLDAASAQVVRTNLAETANEILARANQYLPTDISREAILYRNTVVTYLHDILALRTGERGYQQAVRKYLRNEVQIEAEPESPFQTIDKDTAPFQPNDPNADPFADWLN